MNLEEIKSILKKGLLQIFSANMINKVVQFFTVTVLVRVISVGEYGDYTYAMSIMNVVLLLEGLGVTTGILQYCSVSKDEKEKIGIFKYGSKIGIVVNSILCIGMLLYAIFGNIAIEGSRRFIIMLAFIPMFTLVFNTIQVYLRSTFRNNEFSILTTFNTIVYCIATISLSYLMQAKGLIIGMYIAYISTILLGIWFIRKDLQCSVKIDDFNFNKVKFMKYSIVTVLTNAMSQILYLLDTLLIGVVTKDSAVLAAYKNATTIPFNLAFIPMSIMVFAYPYFAQHKDDKKWLGTKVSQLTKALLVINLIIGIGGIVFAKPIISIVFSSKYLGSVPCFIVLMVGYVISGTFRIPYGNIIASQGMVKVNLIIAIISGLASVVLDVVLISRFGSLGAAYASTLVMIISSIIQTIVVRKIVKGKI